MFLLDIEYFEYVWHFGVTFPVGVWLEGSDGTDINALCRSHSERLVAVADDFCKVHLFHYPCFKPKVSAK